VPQTPHEIIQIPSSIPPLLLSESENFFSLFYPPKQTEETRLEYALWKIVTRVRINPLRNTYAYAGDEARMDTLSDWRTLSYPHISAKHSHSLFCLFVLQRRASLLKFLYYVHGVPDSSMCESS